MLGDKCGKTLRLDFCRSIQKVMRDGEHIETATLGHMMPSNEHNFLSIPILKHFLGTNLECLICKYLKRFILTCFIAIINQIS